MSKPTIGRRALLTIGSLALVAVGVGACQTYNFEPFNPSFYKQYVQVVGAYGITVNSNVMILFDKSGSMDDKASSSSSGKKIDEARSAMVTFMQKSGTKARFGLTFFPDILVDSQCGAPNSVKVAFPTIGNNIGGLPTDTGTDATLQENADKIAQAIKDVIPGGGTPTEKAFKFLGGYEGLSGADRRARYILLVTDGLPNCNATNPNDVCTFANDTTKNWSTVYSSPPASSETDPQKFADFNKIKTALEKCDCQNGALSSCLNKYDCSSGCLNVTGTAAEISLLRTKNIKTIVVGIGDTTNTPAAKTGLSAMARAGGFPRSCPKGTDAECGTEDTCDQQSKVCNRPYYQVTSGTELATTLQNIISALPDPCQFLLQAQPSDKKFLAVIVNGTVIPPESNTSPVTTNWTLEAGVVSFPDKTKICDDIKLASNVQPVKVEFRILQQVGESVK